MAELDLIAWFKNRPYHHASVAVGIGDDAAVTHLTMPQLVTTDMLMDGVHFDSALGDYELIGRKALAVSLSDIAAMGGRPDVAFVSVAFPRGLPTGDCRAVMEGLNRLALEYEVMVAGGDTNSWNGPLVINTTVIGRPLRAPILRSGAIAGDVIFVSGPLGDSLETQHHLKFTPRLRAAAYLALNYSPSSMIDLSDGLITDLGHITTESRCGALLYTEQIPINPSLHHLPFLERLERALTDGEDFELCFTLPQFAQIQLMEDSLCPFKPYPIGVVTSDPGISIRDENNAPITLTRKGYEHFF